MNKGPRGPFYYQHCAVGVVLPELLCIPWEVIPYEPQASFTWGPAGTAEAENDGGDAALFTWVTLIV